MQVYIQLISKLARPIFAYLPKDMVNNLPPGTILQVVLPLYRIPEAGAYWYGTYYKHYQIKLKMVQSTYNPYLMVTNNGEAGPFGVISLQMDNILFLGNEEFI